jgi:hypothetical protein
MEIERRQRLYGQTIRVMVRRSIIDWLSRPDHPRNEGACRKAVRVVRETGMFGDRRLTTGALAIAMTLCACSLTPAIQEGRSTSLIDRACSLPGDLLALTRNGYVERRSGDIALIPRTPAYMTDRGGGWPHSGPWPYLQRVPLVFYGPGALGATGTFHRDATLADVAPTIGRLIGMRLPRADGRVLAEVAPSAGIGPPPKIIVTIVWDGAGLNVLERWPESWPHLASIARRGVSYDGATVGSSPSVTPAVHTSLGSGTFPRTHGIPLIRMRAPNGRIVDSFLDGRSAASLRVPTLAETWDESTGGDALIAMIGYEPWHLGMIGKGAERPGGDRDDAVWIDGASGRWITNDRHYRLPPNFLHRDGLGRFVVGLDSDDGRLDGAWGDEDILGDVSRIVETPAFSRYHSHELQQLIAWEGYGDDDVTDLIFTNFKQIDRVGHRFNMASREVSDSLSAADEALGDLVRFLDLRFAPGEYVLVLTADHGQQPDAADVSGYAIDPTEVARDIDARFGPITQSVLPTELFLHHSVMRRRGVDVEDVARFLGDYRLRDNLQGPLARRGAGLGIDEDERLFALTMPGTMLDSFACSTWGRTASASRASRGQTLQQIPFK